MTRAEAILRAAAVPVTTGKTESQRKDPRPRFTLATAARIATGLVRRSTA